MPLLKTLLGLEHELWKGDGNVYRARLAEDALVVVPGAALTKDETAAAIDASPRWRTVDVDDPRLLHLADGSALVTYRATARRKR